MHCVVRSILLLMLTAGTARAEGIDLAWDQCGPTGETVRTFACDTNAGTERMVASYYPPAGMDAIASLEGVIDLCFNGTFVPSWWMMKNAGTCRQSSILLHGTPPADPIGCEVRWPADVATAFSYLIGQNGWDEIRITMLAVPNADPGTPLDPGLEYFAFALDIDHQKTAGAGACAGCDQPACIVLNGIHLYPPSGPRVDLTNPAESYMLQWQSTVPNCPFIVPARRTTWGAVKAIYR